MFKNDTASQLDVFCAGLPRVKNNLSVSANRLWIQIVNSSELTSSSDFKGLV